jgi:two-component system LytT family response regulator
MIRAIITDDEAHWSAMLITLVKDNCPEIEVLTVCDTATATLRAIPLYKPELLFLDVEMPDMNAFELLDKITPYNFEIILISEHNQHAISAIHYNALDYLLKPVHLDDLKKAVEKARQKIETKRSHTLETVLEQIHNINAIHNIALPTIEGLQMVAINSIVYCASSNNYTNFILKDSSKLHICRTLKQVESLLEGHPFIRVHHSYLVNLNEVKKYIKGEGGTVVMSDNSSINVSRSHKELLLKKFQNGKYGF